MAAVLTPHEVAAWEAHDRLRMAVREVEHVLDQHLATGWMRAHTEETLRELVEANVHLIKARGLLAEAQGVGL